MKVKNEQLAYLFLRLGFGLNFFFHGFVRLFGDYSGFVTNITNGFESTMLPLQVANVFAWIIPPAEFILGAALLVGFKTRWALAGSSALMLILLVGKSLQQEWGTVGSMMVYILFLYFLTKNLKDNVYCLDKHR